MASGARRWRAAFAPDGLVARKMTENEEQPYRVDEQDGRFRVLDESARVIMVCGDENSAAHYAVLLSEAYRRGYKAGYRAGKKA